MYAIHNDQLVPIDRLQVAFSDLAAHRGYGVFDYMRAYQGKVLWLNDYLDRLMQSIAMARLPLSYSRQDIMSSILALVATNGMSDSAIKVLVTGGPSPDYSSVMDGAAQLYITNIPFTPWSNDKYTNGCKLISYKYQRAFPLIKSTNYFTAMMLYRQMIDAGAVEILYGTAYVTECSRSNVFFVKNGEINTPQNDILHGITRKNIMKLLPISETHILWENRYDYDEVFITSTVKGVLPIVAIDDTIVGNGHPGPVTQDLMKHYDAFKQSLL